MRRIYRIFPLYYALVLSCALGQVLFPRFSPFQNPMPVWVFFLFAQNIAAWWLVQPGPGWLGVTWSLAIEEQFYMILPMIVRVMSRKALLWFSVSCVVVAPLLRLALVLSGHVREQVHPLLVTRADTLAWGLLAAIIVRNATMAEWVRRHSKAGYAGMAGAFISAAAVQTWTGWEVQGSIGYSLYGSAYFLLVLLVLIQPLGILKVVFNWGWLRWLGKVSYCLYLIHEPVRQCLALSPLPYVNGISWGSSLCAVPLSLAISQASWVFFERRLIHRAHVLYKYEPLANQGTLEFEASGGHPTRCRFC